VGELELEWVEEVHVGSKGKMTAFLAMYVCTLDGSNDDNFRWGAPFRSSN